ncbi:helix-turn-helix transcriptional regulator [Apibacter raozihei]|uniref:helix-turn-helix domain-containing protein n=1 Tax=Apibacter raozihei TaxID=2500547 RepID=UPI000FE35050|nr:helix-turn-helix transcriptional regulator [Apibacter raozihei]
MEIDNKYELLKLANRIKYLRAKKGVTQEIVYIDTGIHIGRIEQGKRDVSYTTLVKLSKYFNVTLEELVKKL